MLALALINGTEQASLHVFEFTRPGAKQVSVAGGFNGWNKDKNPLTLGSDGRTWRTELKIAPGRYQYKFVVDGRDWVVDPKVKSVPDGSGNPNSEILVEPADYARLPGKRGDGLITTSAFQHQASKPFQVLTASGLRVMFRSRRGDLDGAEVTVGKRTYPATRVTQDDLTETYIATLPPSTKVYKVHLRDGQAATSFGPFSVTNAAKPVNVPGWVPHTVIYHIFPDRFANGNPATDPKDVQPWDSKPTYRSYLGGDLKGIHNKLDYLQDLGIQTIYLNPVFASSSNHGYETSDYSQIEPRFGTNQEFEDLTADMHRRGMKMVLDGVFNHSGTQFFAFADLVKNQQASAYKDWYQVHAWPVSTEGKPTYEAWAGHGRLPKLRVENPAVAEYLLKEVSAWNKRGVDGWRLDAANEVDSAFWVKFRDRIRQDNPQAWACGEIWTDSTAWLQGDQFDSVMNYPFRDAVLRFVAHGTTTPSEFLDALTSNYYLYTPEVAHNLYNLIGSHDTPRFKTFAKGDDQLCALAAVVQFTWPGVPAVYYGDELGMEGGADPDNRRGMRWDLATPDNALLSTYKKLAHLRRSASFLADSAPTPLFADDAHGTLAYARTSKQGALVVVINRSPSVQSIDFSPPAALRPALARHYRNVLTGQPVSRRADGKFSLTLRPKEAAVLLSTSGPSSTATSIRARG